MSNAVDTPFAKSNAASVRVLPPATNSAPFPVLAHRDGIGLMLGLLMHQGAMCSKCGHGTRATSKRWAVCKKCGERTERQALPNNPTHPNPAREG